MIGQQKADLLIKDINENIELFKKRRLRHKNKSLILKLSSIIGSALVTVLLGLKSIQSNLISDIALLLSASITIFNGIEGFYNHRGLWVKDVNTLASLRELKRDLEFYLAGKPVDQLSTKILITYKNRLQIICNDDIKSWNKIKEDQILTEQDEKSGND